MRLLSPSQNKDLKEQQNIRELLRAQETEKAAKKARLALANSQADFSDALAKQRVKWAEEEEEHTKRTAEMQTEINRLEAKRLNALIPVKIIEQSAEERLHEAEEFMEKLREREVYAEDLAEKLQDRLDETGQKDQDLKRKEQDLIAREHGVSHQTKLTAQSSLDLSIKMAEFKEEKSEAETAIKQKQTVLELQEQALVKREEVVDKQDKELKEKAVRLADERNVLDRAWNELRRKQYPHSKTSA